MPSGSSAQEEPLSSAFSSFARTRAFRPEAVFGTKKAWLAILMCASLASSLISIQQPMCWQTAVTVPVVANVLPTYAPGVFATSASATFLAEASIGDPSRSVPLPCACVGVGAGGGAGGGVGVRVGVFGV